MKIRTNDLSSNIVFFIEDTFKKNITSRDYCPYCKNETTLSHNQENTQNVSINEYGNYYGTRFLKNEGVFSFSVICSLNAKHKIHYAFTINSEGKVLKFAKYPFSLIKRKIPNPNEELLKKLKLNEFMYKSYIAAQNELHLAAALYIRKVLEGLVKKIATDNGIKILETKMLGEMIDLIKDHIPIFVKNNIKVYSRMLGNALHNLSELEAREIYQFILKTINMFIHEIEAETNRKKDKKEIEAHIQKFSSK